MVDAMQLNVGDKVLVSTSASFNGSPKGEWAGRTMTIRRKRFNDIAGRWDFRMVEDAGENDGRGWCWREEQLDYFDITTHVEVVPEDLDVGVKVILRDAPCEDRCPGMHEYFGSRATIVAMNDYRTKFLIREDKERFVWSYKQVDRVIDPNQIEFDSHAFDTFLESVVGAVG